MADEELQLPPRFDGRRFEQREAVDGGAMNRLEVGVVGLVVGVGRLAKLLGGERVHEARLEVGLAKGILDGMVISAGALDGDEAVAQIVLGEPCPNLLDRGRQLDTVVSDLGGRD